jgi:hypothetical protein
MLIVIQHILELDFVEALEAQKRMSVFVLDTRHKENLNRRFNCNYPVPPLEEEVGEDFCVVPSAILARSEHFCFVKSRVMKCVFCVSNYCIYDQNVV